MLRNGSLVRRSCAGGFSLVELLVVAAIIGLLVALVAPAIQQARSAAARAGCLSNLRQIGLAMHAYHDAQGRFPPGGVEWRPAGKGRTERQLAWSAFLLPHLEQANVYERLDLSLAFDSPENAAAAAVALPVYLCASVPRTEPRVDGRGACDYGGLFGERITGPNNPPKGAMLYDRAFRIADIPDGLSATIVVAEDAGWREGQWINGRNLFDQAFAINRAPAAENDIRSLHAGGANALFGDAAARFLSEEIDLATLAALCTRAGGEVAKEH